MSVRNACDSRVAASRHHVLGDLPRWRRAVPRHDGKAAARVSDALRLLVQVAEMNQRLRGGYRMPLGDLGLRPDVLTLIQAHCWAEQPEARHTMEQIATVSRPRRV